MNIHSSFIHNCQNQKQPDVHQQVKEANKQLYICAMEHYSVRKTMSHEATERHATEEPGLVQQRDSSEHSLLTSGLRSRKTAVEAVSYMQQVTSIDINLYISTIIISVNGLSGPVKRQKKKRMIFKIFCFHAFTNDASKL